MRMLRRLLGKPYRLWVRFTFRLKHKLRRPVVVRVPGADSICLHSEGQIASCIHAGSYEDFERDLVARHLRQGMTFIDIGANAGLYSLIAEKIVGPAGRVWAFEPSRDSYERLRRNLDLNLATRVKTVKLALSCKDDESLILLREKGQLDGERYLAPRNSPPADPADTENVTTITLDSFCRREGIGSVDFIKMDVEGGEYDVLRGARDTLSANPSLVMVFEHTREGCSRAGSTPVAIAELLAQHGFHLYAPDPKRKIWDSDHDYILSQGNAWAAANSASLPAL